MKILSLEDFEREVSKLRVTGNIMIDFFNFGKLSSDLSHLHLRILLEGSNKEYIVPAQRVARVLYEKIEDIAKYYQMVSSPAVMDSFRSYDLIRESSRSNR